MSFEYIEAVYGIRFKRGQRVFANGKPGVVTSATHRVRVRLNGERVPRVFHPADVDVMEQEKEGES